MTTAWLVLAVGDDREYGGNDGYDDDPSRHYSWDSTVPNHAGPAVGDAIVLWDKKELIGVSVIHGIDTGTAMKKVYFCPVCKRADFKRRQHERPVCRCSKCGALFDTPGEKTKEVTTYRSRHGQTWLDGRGLLTGAELRALCDSPTSQHSIRPARLEKLEAALLAVLEPYLLPDFEETQLAIPGGHRESTVRVRVGQAAFRERLLEEQGENCAFTGPAPAVVLEAAHLYSFAESGEHHDYGGLLLRRDIHRLFDLGYVAVDPATDTLDIDENLRTYPDYGQLHEQPLAIELRREHRAWLTAHWHTHRSDG